MSASNASPLSVLIGWIAGLFGGDDPSNTSPREPLYGAIVEVARGDGAAWGSLSGLAAHATDPTRLYAVTDDNSPPARIVEIDVSGGGARVVRQIAISAPDIGKLDCEALSVKPGGGFWIASEGGDYNDPPNLLLELDAEGRLLRTIGLPKPVADRIGSRGFEGVAFVEAPSGDGLYVSIQGPIDGDPDDLTRIAAVDLASGVWTYWHYPLERLKSDSVSGLSELLHVGAGRFAALERDGKGGRNAVKWVTTFDLATVPGAPFDATPPRIEKRVAVDLVALFLDAGRKVEKEIEGLTIAADGTVYALTDNDSDDSRSTLLLRLGQAGDVFR